MQGQAQPHGWSSARAGPTPLCARIVHVPAWRAPHPMGPVVSCAWPLPPRSVWPVGPRSLPHTLTHSLTHTRARTRPPPQPPTRAGATSPRSTAASGTWSGAFCRGGRGRKRDGMNRPSLHPPIHPPHPSIPAPEQVLRQHGAGAQRGQVGPGALLPQGGGAAARRDGPHGRGHPGGGKRVRLCVRARSWGCATTMIGHSPNHPQLIMHAFLSPLLLLFLSSSLAARAWTTWPTPSPWRSSRAAAPPPGCVMNE